MSNSPSRPGSGGGGASGNGGGNAGTGPGGGGGTGPGRPTKAALLHGLAGNAVLVGLIAVGVGVDWVVGWR
ncbi:MAG: hypothetical protein V4515_15115 [Chloroflexota bacterium]